MNNKEYDKGIGDASSTDPTNVQQIEEKQNRSDILQKLDADLDEFIDTVSQKGFKYEHGWSEENWEEEMERHPAFRTKPFQVGEELPAEFEALQQLKYDPDAEPTDRALSYKQEGNSYFSTSKFHLAVDAYTSGIRVRCEDPQINAVLYTNRAAAHYHLGNYRSSLHDCISARKFSPDHMKAVIRGCMCCKSLGMYGECVSWCDTGLYLLSTNTNVNAQYKSQLMSLRSDADRELRRKEKEGRKQEREKRRAAHHLTRLAQAIIDLGITAVSPSSDSDDEGGDHLDLNTAHRNVLKRVGYTHLTGHSTRGLVTLIDTTLYWPLRFVYPQFQQWDIIEQANENDTFDAHFQTMFSDARGEWGECATDYTPNNVHVYYEGHDSEPGQLYHINSQWTLRQTITILKNRLEFDDGQLTFIMLSKGGSSKQFTEQFASKYTLHDAGSGFI